MFRLAPSFVLRLAAQFHGVHAHVSLALDWQAWKQAILPRGSRPGGALAPRLFAPSPKIKKISTLGPEKRRRHGTTVWRFRSTTFIFFFPGALVYKQYWLDWCVAVSMRKLPWIPSSPFLECRRLFFFFLSASPRGFFCHASVSFASCTHRGMGKVFLLPSASCLCGTSWVACHACS
ncbi:hypothetical protein HDK77DRAFT_291832 [Phyllosticta capitalensis]|uniref:Secreted protein n=1 Tax=Phyllosticta capitalensis TaxID=121624 RepID=A0ABR1YG21_9PEZI